MSVVMGISAVTLGTHDMARAVSFYERLGFTVSKGGGDTDFTTFDGGNAAFNIILADDDRQLSWWGRVIFQVENVDETYKSLLNAGIRTQFEPTNAHWGERYFHITDPDGHEISFVTPLSR